MPDRHYCPKARSCAPTADPDDLRLFEILERYFAHLENTHRSDPGLCAAIKRASTRLACETRRLNFTLQLELALDPLPTS